MKHIFTVTAGIVISLGLSLMLTQQVQVALGAPATEVTFQKNLIPLTDSLYTLGTTTKAWLNVFTDELCLSGDCKTAWPAGGAGGGSGTVLYVQNGGATQNTGTTTLNFTPNSFTLVESPADTFAIRVATTTLGLLTTNVSEGSNLYYTDARVSSYMSASSTYQNLLSFYTTPSTRITAGTGIDWSGNTLNGVYTAGDALTLTGEDFDFDGGATPAGALGGTWASPTVDDDGHNHTSATLSGIDISADTNLSADGTEIVLTGDALSLGNALTYTNGTSTNFAVSTSLNLFGGGAKTTANDLCIQLTGNASLCDGSDATGGSGGSDVNWSWTSPNTFISPATTTNGIIVRASSTIGNGLAGGGLTVNGPATTTGLLNVGGYGNTLQSGITSPTAFFNASTSGRSGVVFQNYGGGAAPEFRFTVGDPYSASQAEYLAFGLTNSNASAGGALYGFQKTDLAYIVSNSGRDLAISAGNTGSSLYLTAGNTGSVIPQFKLDGTTGRIGINIATTTTPTSTLSVNGDIYTANIIATGTATSSNIVATTGVNLFGGGMQTTNNALCIQLTGSSDLCDGSDASGGGGGSISTSSIPTAGNLSYWSSASTLSDVATGTLTETVSGLELSATRGLVGGSAILSVTSGFVIPSTTPWSDINNFYNTPSTRITAGTGIDWTANTLNTVLTAGDGLTLTVEDFDCDTATGSVFGCLTALDWTSFNGRVSSTSIDTSSELATLLTDETGTGNAVFSANSVFSGITSFSSFTGVNATITNATTTNATSTNLAVSGSIKLFGGTTVTTNNALCILLTGTADLCDGSDATGGGGGVRTYSMIVDADGAGDYTTIQGALDACGTSGGGSIYLSDPYYYIGGTGLTFKSNDCQVYGIYASTTIEIAGATTAFKTNSAASTYANVGVHNVVIVGDGTAGSVGIDMSDMIRSRYTGIIMDNVDIGFKLNDTQNVTFYNTVRDFAITTLGSYGIYASSTNPTNDNKFSDGFIGCTASCTGIHLNNAQANSFTNLSIEPGSVVGTIGVKLEVSTGASNNGTFGNKFTNLYAEANGIGIYASSTNGTKEVEGNTFDGGQIVANTIDVIDRSNNGGAVQFNGTIVNYNINNTFATTTISSIVATLGTFTNTVVSTLATFLNVVVTGLLDVGAGVLEIPNGSAPTVDSIGELAIDSTSNQLVLYGSEKKVIGNGNIYSSFTYATSTAWTGTTTIPLGTAYVAETWNGIQCFTDAGTLNVSVSDGTNRMNTNAASTTVGTTAFTTNNTFTANEKRYVDVGTPASSPTKISCTISKSITAD